MNVVAALIVCRARRGFGARARARTSRKDILGTDGRDAGGVLVRDGRASAGFTTTRALSSAVLVLLLGIEAISFSRIS